MRPSGSHRRAQFHRTHRCRAHFQRSVLLLCALLAPLGRAHAEPYAATRAADLRTRLLPVEERILVLTPDALERFDPATEAWTRTTRADGLPSPPLQFAGVSSGNTWVAGTGIAFSDVRFDDWRLHRPGAGFPGRAVFAVVADEDYAYAATDSGAARFDRFVLEWEPIASGAGLGPVGDVAMDDDRVWFGLAHGVAEYRKETESVRIDSLLGGLNRPRVLIFASGPVWLWAITDQGIARYDRSLQSWTSYRPGLDFPDARLRAVQLLGDDLWLGTDEGLWRFRAETGLWRREESGETMPGREVRAFAIEPDAIWTATERALAVYQPSSARWIDFTESVPIAPGEPREILKTAGMILLRTEREIVYGLPGGETNPTRFTWRSHALPVTESGSGAISAPGRPRIELQDSGLTFSRADGTTLTLKGGTTLFLESRADPNGGGLGPAQTEYRTDLILNGRLPGERALNGFYNTTDPDNPAYQLTWRGARDDALREASLGEITSDPYNSRLTPGTGLRGGQVRLEAGPRSTATRRRLLTADAWGGSRRTLPGHDVFIGDRRNVAGERRDLDYAARTVFHLPPEWSAAEERVRFYRDDGSAETDDANTEHRTIAGSEGAWDRLQPAADYLAGPTPGTIILAASLQPGGRLVAVREAGGPGDANEMDLTSRWLKNHYFIGPDPVPGSLTLAIADTSGATAGADGHPYLRRFGLDRDADGLLDPQTFSPSTGYLIFPDTLPFPSFVYADSASSAFVLRYAYAAKRPTFELQQDDIVPGSERITVDGELLRANLDYTIIPASGLFSFYEHIALDDDSIIETRYLYEQSGGEAVVSGQLGIAPTDPLFLGMNATRWEDSREGSATAGDLNARLEWKGARHLLRVSPEWALSNSEGRGAGTARGGALQARYRALELTAAHRALDDEYVSLEDRRTRLGRLRQASETRARLGIGGDLWTELSWDRTESAADSSASGSRLGGGTESSLFGTLRLLRAGLPNLELRRGRVAADSAGHESTRWVSRADLELNPGQAGIRPLGLPRLWLRAFVQRSDRAASGVDDRITDTGFARLNGSTGDRLSWDIAFEDQRTHRTGSTDWQDLRRRQRLDLTLQSRPHASLDAYGRLESTREMHYLRRRAPGGFTTDRLGLATFQFIPGRLHARLAPLSFRLDWLARGSETGDPGIPLAGVSSLWREASQASQSRQTRNVTIEARLQALAWLRLMERCEREITTVERIGTGGETRDLQWETRLEMQPVRGLITLRGLTGRVRVPEWSEARTRRFIGQWDQAWGGGLLTSISLDALHADNRNRNLTAKQRMWNPQSRITWRRSRWQSDASLGLGLVWDRRRQAEGDWSEARRFSLDLSLSVRPHRVIMVEGQYAITRSESDDDSGTTQQEARFRGRLYL